jgi:NADH dehydrogenase FAD-containing subunit
MKQRLPRKAKKRVKKKLKFITGLRMAQTAVVALNARFQVMDIISTPLRDKASKALEIANVTVNTAQTVSKILSEKPNHWKDFLKPVC